MPIKRISCCQVLHTQSSHFTPDNHKAVKKTGSGVSNQREWHSPKRRSPLCDSNKDIRAAYARAISIAEIRSVLSGT
jgi:hypothetical protein